MKHGVLQYYTPITNILTTICFSFLFNFPPNDASMKKNNERKGLCVISLKKYQQCVVYVLLSVFFFVLCCSIDPVSPMWSLKLYQSCRARDWWRQGIVSWDQTSRHGDITSPHAPHFVFKHISALNARWNLIKPLFTRGQFTEHAIFQQHAAPTSIISHMKPGCCPVFICGHCISCAVLKDPVIVGIVKQVSVIHSPIQIPPLSDRTRQTLDVLPLGHYYFFLSKALQNLVYLQAVALREPATL